MPGTERAWVAGWVVSRGSPRAAAEPWGLRIELGAPGHIARLVLLDADGAAITALAESVTAPTTSIKGFMKSADLGRLLTPDWTPDPPEVLMTAALRPAAVPVARDYRLAVDRAGGVTYARVTTGDGSAVARGQAVVNGEACVFDQVETAPRHRRRGLGSAVMAALTTAAIDLGAATGILGATVQGRALYETLDWKVAGPLSSFVYKRPRIAVAKSGTSASRRCCDCDRYLSPESGFCPVFLFDINLCHDDARKPERLAASRATWFPPGCRRELRLSLPCGRRCLLRAGQRAR